MAIKMDWGSVLAEGVLGGIAGYAGEIGAENKQARANEQAQTLEQMKADAALATKKAGMHLSHPEYHTVKETDANGNVQEVAYKDTFNMTGGADGTGGWDSEKVGTAPVVDKTPPVTRTVPNGLSENFEQYDPKAKTWTTLGTGPRFAPQANPMAGMEAFAAKADITEAAREKAAAAADVARTSRDQTAQDKRATTSANAATNAGMRQFYAASDQGQMLALYNIDPNDPQAATKYKSFLQQSNYEAAGLAAPAESTVGQPYVPPKPGWSIMHPFGGGQPAAPSAAPKAAPTSPLTEQNAPMPANPDAGSGWSAKPNAHGAVVAIGTNAAGQRVAKYADGTIAPLPAAGP